MDSAQATFERLSEGLPRFPDGRIDYTGVQEAPVINTVCYCRGKIHILKRSQELSTYGGLWNGVSGFIDEPKPLTEFVKQEINEELGVLLHVKQISLATPYQVVDTDIDRTWHVFPALAMFDVEPTIALDWEHEDYKWIEPAELKSYEIVSDFDKSVNMAFKLLIGFS